MFTWKDNLLSKSLRWIVFRLVWLTLWATTKSCIFTCSWYITPKSLAHKARESFLANLSSCRRLRSATTWTCSGTENFSWTYYFSRSLSLQSSSSASFWALQFRSKSRTPHKNRKTFEITAWRRWTQPRTLNSKKMISRCAKNFILYWGSFSPSKK